MLKNGQVCYAGNFEDIKKCQQYIEFAVATVKELTRHVKEFTEKSMGISVLESVLEIEHMISEQLDYHPSSLKQKSDLSDLKDLIHQANIEPNRKVSQNLDSVFARQSPQSKTNCQLPLDPELKDDQNLAAHRSKLFVPMNLHNPDDDTPKELFIPVGSIGYIRPKDLSVDDIELDDKDWQVMDQSPNKDKELSENHKANSAIQLTESNLKDKGKISKAETRYTGFVGVKTFWSYFKMAGLSILIVNILLFILVILLKMVAEWWLVQWANNAYTSLGESNYPLISLGLVVLAT